MQPFSTFYRKIRKSAPQKVDKWSKIWYRIKDSESWGGEARLRIPVMGVEFDCVTMDQALARAAELLENRQSAYCVTPNAEIVYEAIQDPDFRELLNQADIVLPDGAGVVLGAKLLGTPLPGKVAGIEFGERLCDMLTKRGGSLYLLGGKPVVAEQAAQKLTQRHPGLVICGTAHGYFQDEAAAVERIRAAKPDVLFVCLGAPKQERFMRAHCQALPGCLMAGLGGSLDGYAGIAKRAPKWMIRCNLEWLYRLIKQPRRLGRMMRLPKFILLCLGERRRQNG